MAKGSNWGRGESIDWINETGSDVEHGDIVAFGSYIGIAGTDIPDGEVGSLIMSGLWILPKDSAAITAGADVYYTAANGTVSATNGTGSIQAGYAVKDAAADDTTVIVKLRG